MYFWTCALKNLPDPQDPVCSAAKGGMQGKGGMGGMEREEIERERERERQREDLLYPLVLLCLGFWEVLLLSGGSP